VLSGPQALVAARPPSDEVAQKLSSVWADVVAATDLESLVSRLMHWGLDVVPDLIVIVDDNGLSCVVRGLLTVRDADDGNVVADGRGQTAWRAAILRTRHIIIDLPGENPVGVHLPLAVGVVSASSIEVDARDGARVDVGEGLSFPAPIDPSPQLRLVPDLPPAPVSLSVPHPAVVPMPVPEPMAPQMEPEPQPVMRQPMQEPAQMPQQAPEQVPQASVAQLWPTSQQAPEQAPMQQMQQMAPEPGIQPNQMPMQPNQMPMQPNQMPMQPSQMQQQPMQMPQQMAAPAPEYPMGPAEGQPGVNEDGRFVRQFIPSGPLPVGEAAQMMPQMAPQPMPQMAPQAPQMSPQAGPPAGQQDPDRYDWWQPEPAPAPEPVYQPAPAPMREPPAASQQSNDFNSPTGATELDFIDGQRVPVGDPVLVGRAPQAYPGEEARLIRVASPHHDISRTHVRIELYDGAVWATDRDSTNGTIIHNPGQEPITASPNQPVHVWVGGVIDIGDGVMIRVR